MIQTPGRQDRNPPPYVPSPTLTIVVPSRARNLDSRRLNTEEFNLAVYQVVKAVPLGKVITCGHVAKLIGFPSQAHRVREAVKFITHTTPPVPWHRVIATSGVISTNGPNDQQRLLEAEGVEVSIGVVEESRVAVERWGWFPEVDEFRFDEAFMAEPGGQEWGA